MEWDPVGVAEFEQVSDEYDCMLSPLLEQLDAGAEGEQIRDWLADEIEGHFGMISIPAWEAALAARIREWWDDGGRLRVWSPRSSPWPS